MSDLWTIAGNDAERADLHRRVALAKEAAADVIGFILDAYSPDDFVNRKDLSRSSLVAAAESASDGISDIAARVLAEMEQDIDQEFVGDEMAEEEVVASKTATRNLAFTHDGYHGCDICGRRIFGRNITYRGRSGWKGETCTYNVDCIDSAIREGGILDPDPQTVMWSDGGESVLTMAGNHLKVSGLKVRSAQDPFFFERRGDYDIFMYDASEFDRQVFGGEGRIYWLVEGDNGFEWSGLADDEADAEAQIRRVLAQKRANGFGWDINDKMDNTRRHIRSWMETLQDGYWITPVTGGPGIHRVDGQFYVDPSGEPWLTPPAHLSPMDFEDALEEATRLVYTSVRKAAESDPANPPVGGFQEGESLWDVENEGWGEDGADAADVADVPTPGQEVADYPKVSKAEAASDDLLGPVGSILSEISDPKLSGSQLNPYVQQLVEMAGQPDLGEIGSIVSEVSGPKQKGSRKTAQTDWEREGYETGRSFADFGIFVDTNLSISMYPDELLDDALRAMRGAKAPQALLDFERGFFRAMDEKSASRKTSSKSFDVSICVDCLLFTANGDLPEGRPEFLADYQRMTEGGIVALSDDEGSFSSSSCDTCGSRLGGDRFDATLIMLSSKTASTDLAQLFNTLGATVRERWENEGRMDITDEEWQNLLASLKAAGEAGKIQAELEYEMYQNTPARNIEPRHLSNMATRLGLDGYSLIYGKNARRFASQRYEIAKQVVESRQAADLEGHLLDTSTAQMLVAVYEALSPENQERFDEPDLLKLVEMGWRNVAKRVAKKRAWKAPASEKSGACARGDHNGCRMTHILDTYGSSSCLCRNSIHGVKDISGFKADPYSDMSGACADGDHEACRMNHPEFSDEVCLCEALGVH